MHAQKFDYTSFKGVQEIENKNQSFLIICCCLVVKGHDLYMFIHNISFRLYPCP